MEVRSVSTSSSMRSASASEVHAWAQLKQASMAAATWAASAGIPSEAAQVAAAIEACLSCAQACTSDADADLIEDDVDTLRTSIALDQDCADIDRKSVA